MERCPKWNPFGILFRTSFILGVLAHFCSISGPPSGGHFQRKHKENQRFPLFWSSKKAYFWISFGSILTPFLAPFWNPFRTPFGPRPNPPFGIVFRPARPSLGAEARKLSPEANLQNNFIGNYLNNFMMKFPPEKVFSCNLLENLLDNFLVGGGLEKIF